MPPEQDDARARQLEVSSLQGLRRPEGRTAPDWASKIHLAVAPGATQPWRDLVASATGSPLGPAAFLAGLAA
jgi:hypothetical protein